MSMMEEYMEQGMTEEEAQDANEAKADMVQMEIKESLAGLNGKEEQIRAKKLIYGSR